jgi:hypothetical protein
MTSIGVRAPASIAAETFFEGVETNGWRNGMMTLPNALSRPFGPSAWFEGDAAAARVHTSVDADVVTRPSMFSPYCVHAVVLSAPVRSVSPRKSLRAA